MNTVSDNVKEPSEQNEATDNPDQESVETRNAEAAAEDAASEPKTFDELLESETLLSAINTLGFTEPTTVQRRTIPLALKGKDLIVQAKTGSGKTFAFALPLLAKMEAAGLTKKAKHTYALVLTPTRELALQIREVVEALIPDVKPACLIGGADINKQKAELKRDKRFVVGTPGRVLDLLKQKELRLNRVGYFVLDEADEMLSMGFLEDVRAILSRLPEKRQGLFVSATITPRVDMIANSFLKKAQQIHGDEADDQQPPIEHLFVEVKGDVLAKPDALCDIIETYRPDSAIVFCNTRSDTQMVEALLRRRGFDARRINSDLTQGQRDKIMRKIKSKDLRILIATDIAARGLDIDQISLIVNYSIHEQPEIYVHRTGRTGRAGRAGRAISLVGPHDFGAFHFVTKVLDVEFQKMELPSDREVCTARLAHLYQILRETKMDVLKRDLIIARKMISELNGEAKTTKEFEYTVAKLCRSLLEKHMRQDTKALDEEFESAEAAPAKDRDSERGRGRGRDRDRDRGRGRDRNDRSSRDRGGDRRDSKRDSRNDRDSYRSDDNKERRQYDSDNRDRDSRRDRRSDEQSQPQEIRLYVGQGKENGMTEDLFKELAAGMADLDEALINRLTFRKRHGFVDLCEPHASQLMSALNGIEYNGITLPVERAALLSQPRRDNRGSQRRGSDRHGGDRRGGGRGGDRRGGDRRGGGRGGDRRSGDRRGGGGGRSYNR